MGRKNEMTGSKMIWSCAIAFNMRLPQQYTVRVHMSVGPRLTVQCQCKTLTLSCSAFLLEKFNAVCHPSSQDVVLGSSIRECRKRFPVFSVTPIGPMSHRMQVDDRPWNEGPHNLYSMNQRTFSPENAEATSSASIVERNIPT
jgi:hypothetical protein